MSEVTTVKLLNDDEGNPFGYLLNGSMSVPMAEGNRHYRMIQEWIAEGNTPEPADPPVTPDITSITKLQFVEWCEANNKLTDLQALLNSDATLMFKWNAATSLVIDNPLVIGAAATLSLDVQAVFNEIGAS